MATMASMKTIDMMIARYNLDTHSHPSTLDDLVPKYIERIGLDGWRRPYLYTTGPTKEGKPYEFRSAGRDGRFGTKDDIDIWKIDEDVQP